MKSCPVIANVFELQTHQKTMKTKPLYFFLDEPQFAVAIDRQYAANLIKAYRSGGRHVVRREGVNLISMTLKYPNAATALINFERIKIMSANNPPLPHNPNPWVFVIRPGQDDEDIWADFPSHRLAVKALPEVGEKADVMKRLDNGQLTTEF